MAEGRGHENGGPGIDEDTQSLRTNATYPDCCPTQRKNSTSNEADLEKYILQQADCEEVENDEETRRCYFCIKKGHFTVVDVVLIITGVISYIVDFVLDLILAVQYFRQDRKLWSAMTFLFVLLPSVVLQYFSFRWFMNDVNKQRCGDLRGDRDHQGQSDQTDGHRSRIETSLSWLSWLLSHIFQLGTIQRYWRHLKFSYRSPKDEKDTKRMIAEFRDISLLRVLEAFLEAAPQLVFQMYIMLETEEVYWLTACSVATSLVSISWALGAYQKALRDAREDRKEITYLSVVLRVAWRLFTISARVLAMAFFAAVYEWWIFVVTGFHWVIMTAWLIWQKTDFCESNRFEEIFFDAIIGIIHIFCFFNMKEGQTRYRALFFYTVVFLENTLMIGMWYGKQESRERVYGLPILIVVWGCFFIGIFFMMFYYRFCHPNGKLPLCVRILEEPEVDKAKEGHSQDDLGTERSVSTTEVFYGKLEVDGPQELGGTETSYLENIKTTLRDQQHTQDKINLFSYRSRRNIQPHLL